MARSVRHDAAAEEDLIEIWLFTTRMWSTEQADQYLDALRAAIQRLQRNPRTGARRDELGPGCYSKRVLRHVIFYTFDTKSLRVLRVLHGAMDPGRHL